MATSMSQTRIIDQMELTKLWASLNEMSYYQKQEDVEYFTHCTTLSCRRSITKDGRLYGFFTDMPKYSPLCQNQEVEGVWLSVSRYNGKLPNKSPYGNHRAAFSVSDILSYMSRPSPYTNEYDEDESEESLSSMDEDSNANSRPNVKSCTPCKTEGMTQAQACNVLSDDDVIGNESNDDDRKCLSDENGFCLENLVSLEAKTLNRCVSNENESESEPGCETLVQNEDDVRNKTFEDVNQRGIHNTNTGLATTCNNVMETDLTELGNPANLKQNCVITPLLFFECAHYFQARDQYVRLVMIRSDDKHIKWCRNNLLEVDLKNNPFLSWDGHKVSTTRNDRSSYMTFYVEMLVVGDILTEELENGIEWIKVGKTQRASRDPNRGVYRNSKKRY